MSSKTGDLAQLEKWSQSIASKKWKALEGRNKTEDLAQLENYHKAYPAQMIRTEDV